MQGIDAPAGDAMEEALDDTARLAGNCPSAHCNRRGECASPSECCSPYRWDVRVREVLRKYGIALTDGKFNALSDALADAMRRMAKRDATTTALTAAKARGAQAERERLLRDPLLGAQVFFGEDDAAAWRNRMLAWLPGWKEEIDALADAAKQAGVRQGLEMAAEWHRGKADDYVAEAKRWRKANDEESAASALADAVCHQESAAAISALVPPAPEGGEGA